MVNLRQTSPAGVINATPSAPEPFHLKTLPESPTPKSSSLSQAPLWIGAVPLLIFLVVSAINLALAKHFTETGKAIVSNSLGSLWQWMVVFVFLIAIAIAISPVGQLRLGGATAKPSLKFFDWCAVLICTLLAGGGVFWLSLIHI